MAFNNKTLIALFVFCGLLNGCAVNPSTSTGNEFKKRDSILIDKTKSKLILWRNWHFENGGVYSAFFINDKLACEFRSGVCSFELEPGEYQLSFAMPSSHVKEGTKASTYNNGDYISNFKISLIPNKTYSIYADSSAITSGLIEGVPATVYGNKIYTPNTTSFTPLVRDEVSQRKLRETQLKEAELAQEKEKVARQKLKQEQQRKEVEKKRLAQIEAAKTPQQKLLEQELQKWNKEKNDYSDNLNREYKKLMRDWRDRCNDIMQNFFETDFGPGEHNCDECERCEHRADRELMRFNEDKKVKIEQWKQQNPQPTIESTTSTIQKSNTDMKGSNTGSPDIIIKKMSYKGETVDTTTAIPEIYYGTYVFTKEDTPGFDQTYHFNKDGTGYFKHNSDGPTKTDKITMWGVLVEDNKVAERTIKYFFWTDRKARGMTVVYLFEDGTAGYNTFFINDGKPCVFGPFGAVIEKSAP